MAKSKLYIQLLKARLSALVVFSGGFGYLLANDGPLDYVKFFVLLISSFLITGSANTVNQVLEIEFDKLMKRTQNRPLPTGSLSKSEAIIFAVIIGAIGSILMYLYVNPISALLSLLSLILYAFVYTPMKRVSSASVFIGAFPGALPPLIGWAAASGEVTKEALVIFFIQFIWQFPHFWAIAWLGEEDYSKAGFKMLPSRGGKDLNTTFLILVYTLFLIPIGILPSYFGISGHISAVIATICGVLFLVQSFELLKKGTNQAARKILFGSFFYLPIVQLAYLFDKI